MGCHHNQEISRNPMSKAILLLNLGTPAEPTAKGLRDFYEYFLSDPYVFDMKPWVGGYCVI